MTKPLFFLIQHALRPIKPKGGADGLLRPTAWLIVQTIPTHFEVSKWQSSARMDRKNSINLQRWIGLKHGRDGGSIVLFDEMIKGGDDGGNVRTDWSFTVLTYKQIKC